MPQGFFSFPVLFSCMQSLRLLRRPHRMQSSAWWLFSPSEEINGEPLLPLPVEILRLDLRPATALDQRDSVGTLPTATLVVATLIVQRRQEQQERGWDRGVKVELQAKG